MSPLSMGLCHCVHGVIQEYLVAVRGFCSKLTSARLQQLMPGQVQRLQEFLACQETKHEQSASELDTFGDMVVGAVTAACHAALEHLEAQLSQACSSCKLGQRSVQFVLHSL